MTDSSCRTISSPSHLNRGELYYFLKSRKGQDRDELFARVDRLRLPLRLDDIHAFGLIALSSFCVRDCVYCGYRADSPLENMFRLTRTEILAAAECVRAAGLTRVILRSGCDPSLSAGTITELIRDIISATGLEIILSLSERDPSCYADWARAGARAYWLSHDTCDPTLYHRIRPSMHWVDRSRSLEALRHAGLRLGTGILLGMPNQSHESLVDDLCLFCDPAISLAAVEPYLPPPGTPGYTLMSRPENQIVSTELPVMEKAIAALRLLRPELTIALGNAHYRAYNPLESGDLFLAGANALLFDFTPAEYLGLRVYAPLLGIPAREGRAVSEARQTIRRFGLVL